MNSPAKRLSDTDPKRFLQQAFLGQQRVLQEQLNHAATSITHAGKQGEVTEKHFLNILRAYLPRRYAADSAIVIDSGGHTSDQIDVVIYDPQYTPALLDQEDQKYVTAEAVYAVFEVKPAVSARYLDYAGRKARSVRRLHRTSIPIPHAGGEYPPKDLFPITAGLVAARADWSDCLGRHFQDQFAGLHGLRRLDCVLALNDRSYDVFAKDGSATVSPPNNSLVFFLFRLLQRLQSLGTVPAIDWSAYATQLAGGT